MTYNNSTGKAKEQADKISVTDKVNVSGYSSTLTNVEWAQINPGTVIVATADRSVLCQSSSIEDRFTQPMNFPGSVATSKKLLDGAIAAAKYAVNSLDGAIAAAKYAVNSNVRPPALTATRWVWRLAGLYHQTHPIPQLMEEAARRFEKAGHSFLAQWATEKAKEEAGHDLLALRDIQSLGYDAEAVVETLVPPSAKVLIDYFTRSIQDLDPIDCVGYAYTMERLALGVDEHYIQKVKALLPPNIQATSCLKVHSSLGSDTDHTEDTVEMIAGLTSLERTRIARACYETALLCFSPPNNDYISDEELQQVLQTLKL